MCPSLTSAMMSSAQGGPHQTTWYRRGARPSDGESVTFAPLEEVVREATGVSVRTTGR